MDAGDEGAINVIDAGGECGNDRVGSGGVMASSGNSADNSEDGVGAVVMEGVLGEDRWACSRECAL